MVQEIELAVALEQAALAAGLEPVARRSGHDVDSSGADPLRYDMDEAIALQTRQRIELGLILVLGHHPFSIA